MLSEKAWSVIIVKLLSLSLENIFVVAGVSPGALASANALPYLKEIAVSVFRTRLLASIGAQIPTATEIQEYVSANLKRLYASRYALLHAYFEHLLTETPLGKNVARLIDFVGRNVPSVRPKIKSLTAYRGTLTNEVAQLFAENAGEQDFQSIRSELPADRFAQIPDIHRDPLGGAPGPARLEGIIDEETRVAESEKIIEKNPTAKIPIPPYICRGISVEYFVRFIRNIDPLEFLSTALIMEAAPAASVTPD